MLSLEWPWKRVTYYTGKWAEEFCFRELAYFCVEHYQKWTGKKSSESNSAILLTQLKIMELRLFSVTLASLSFHIFYLLRVRVASPPYLRPSCVSNALSKLQGIRQWSYLV